MTYVFKKTGVLIATLLLVSLLAFLAFQIIPADPVTMMLGTDYTPERAEALRHRPSRLRPGPRREARHARRRNCRLGAAREH